MRNMHNAHSHNMAHAHTPDESLAVSYYGTRLTYLANGIVFCVALHRVTREFVWKLDGTPYRRY
jgi:hypothetical protein